MSVSKLVKAPLMPLAIILLGILIVVLLPVIIPVLAVDQWLYNRRLLAAARRFTCPACGSVIGEEAVRLANKAWDQHYSEEHPEGTGFLVEHRRRRIVRSLRAICPSCGARYDFNKRGRTFTAIGAGGW